VTNSPALRCHLAASAAALALILPLAAHGQLAPGGGTGSGPPVIRPGAPPATPPADGKPRRTLELLPMPHVVVPMERFELSNGIRVVVVHTPDSPRQSILTLLPVSVADEPADHAMWSQLAEQLMVRSTNPDSDEDNGMTVKGTVGPRSLLLETSGRPATLLRQARTHAGWLGAQGIQEDTLDRSKARLRAAPSEPATQESKARYTVAGWNQAIRHGKDVIHVLGDPERATLEEARAFVREQVPVGPETLVASIGPIAVEHVKKFLEDNIGSVPARKAAPEGAVAYRPTEPEQEVRVQWDMPTRHLVLWWPLSKEQMEDRANLESAIAVMKSAIMISQPAQGGGRPVPVVEGPLPPAIEGSAGTLLIDIPYGAGTAEPADIRKETETSIRLVADPQFTSTPWRPRLILPLLGMSPPPYTPQQRSGIKELGNLLEKQWLQTTMQWEFDWGKTREAIAKAIDETTIESVQRLIRPVIESPPRLLVLEQMQSPASGSAAPSAPSAPAKPADGSTGGSAGSPLDTNR